MYKPIRRIVLSFALALSPLAAAGPFAATQLAMRSMGVEEGLPNSRVHATLRDHKGRLWVGTQEGAAFLGGSGWTVFPLPKEAPSNYIRALAETPDRALWFGTEAGGLWRWKQGRWRQFFGGGALPASRINALLVDGAGLWVGTAGGGLHRIDGDQATAIKGPADPWVWTIAQVPDAVGRLQVWVGGEKQVWIQEPEGWRELSAKDGWWKGGANAIVVRRTATGNSEAWISSWGFGVGVWDPARQRFRGPLPDFPSRNPTCMTISKFAGGEEELWVGTYDAGLFKRTAQGWEHLGPGQGFPSTSVYSLLANPEGRPSFWAGTRGAGLIAVDPAGWRTLPDDPRVPSRQANCFLETFDGKDGRIFWIGTDKGLVRWDSRGPSVETSAHGLPGEFITGLLEIRTPAGPEIWASTIGGIARRHNGRWEAFGRKQGLTFYRVQCLAVDATDPGNPKLYAGADGGLVSYEHGTWKQFGTQEGLPHSIVTNLLVSREPDGSGCLWVGTRGGGLGRLKNGRWQVFGTQEGLPNASVYGLAQSVSPKGRRWLWLALLGGGGLARMDMDHPEQGFRSWTQEDLPGLRNQGIQSITVSRQDSLYLTTTAGVARLELVGEDSLPGRILTFSPSDGLPSSATSAAGATHLDRDGRVWVGTVKGVAVLDPLAEKDPATPPLPLVERVTVMDRDIDPDLPFRLGFRDRQFSVSYSLPVFHRHEAIHYRTQLLGFDPVPQPWTGLARREFTTLPARSYVLRIWARDGLGRESPPRDLPFVVEPPPWFTWWAIALELGLLGGLGYLVVYRRQRILERRTRELEQVVSDRTRELAAANAALHTRSLTDPLTGLSNRRALDESMGEITRRYLRRHMNSPIGPSASNRDIAFLILDLDHFKSVNDTHGHAAGDCVLQQTAAILRETVRDTDRLVRWGGEEFIVVAVDTNLDEIPAFAERIRAAIEEHPFDIGEAAPLRRTVSVGFACMPLLYADPGRLNWLQTINLADQCLYQAKQGGRNRWIGLLPLPEADLNLDVDHARLDVAGLVRGGWAELRTGP